MAPVPTSRGQELRAPAGHAADRRRSAQSELARHHRVHDPLETSLGTESCGVVAKVLIDDDVEHDVPKSDLALRVPRTDALTGPTENRLGGPAVDIQSPHQDAPVEDERFERRFLAPDARMPAHPVATGAPREPSLAQAVRDAGAVDALPVQCLLAVCRPGAERRTCRCTW